MNIKCCRCDIFDPEYMNIVEVARFDKWTACMDCENKFYAMARDFFQPERSKREDSHSCEMRCSEHCGNTVREVQ